jgi:hypothetical protein
MTKTTGQLPSFDFFAADVLAGMSTSSPFKLARSDIGNRTFPSATGVSPAI